MFPSMHKDEADKLPHVVYISQIGARLNTWPQEQFGCHELYSISAQCKREKGRSERRKLQQIERRKQGRNKKNNVISITSKRPTNFAR